MRIREFETGIFYGKGPLLDFTKYNANAVKIDPWWGLFLLRLALSDY